MANGKSNPFNPDGKSGAGAGGGASQGAVLNRVPTQRSGSTINPASGPGGVALYNPPSNRGGLVADPRRQPFKLNGSSSKPAPLVEDDMVPAGSLGDSGDPNDDPTAGA